MPQVTLTGHIIVPETLLAAVIQALPDHIALTRAEQGCLSFSVIQDDENKHRFNVAEVFSDQQAFELHQQRVKASDWGRIAADAERHYTIS